MERKFNVNSDVRKKKRESLRFILHQHFSECEAAIASNDRVKIRGALIKLEDKKARLDKLDAEIDSTLIFQLDQLTYNQEMKEMESYHDQCVMLRDQLNQALYSSTVTGNRLSMDNFSDSESLSASQVDSGCCARSCKRGTLVDPLELNRSSLLSSRSPSKRIRPETVVFDDVVEEIYLSDDDDVNDDLLRNKGEARNLKQEINVGGIVLKGEVNIEPDVVKNEIEQLSRTDENIDFLESNINLEGNVSAQTVLNLEATDYEPGSIQPEFNLESAVYEPDPSQTDHNYACNYSSLRPATQSDPVQEVLNDDNLLFQIFNNLEIPDLIVIERVCKKWKQASLDSWRIVRSIDIYETFKVKQFELYHLEEILRRAGKYLNHLDCSYLRSADKEIALSQNLPAKTSLELISSYCDRLTSLCLNFTWNEKNYLNFLGVNVLKNLKSLTVGNETFSDENLPMILKTAVNLETFSIAGYDYSDNTLLNLSKTCKTLSVFGTRKFSNEMLEKEPPENTKFGCFGLIHNTYRSVCFERQLTALALLGNASFFQNFVIFTNFLHFPNLKILDISMNHKYITGEVLQSIVDNCSMIEELRIRKATGVAANDFKCLENLKNLKFLDVSYTKISGPVLIDLAKKLERFQQIFCHGCSTVPGPAISEVIDVSKELRYIAISSSKLTKKLIKVCLSSLLKRKNNVSLIISLRSEKIKEVPEQVEKLNLKGGIKNYSKTSILRVVCGLEDHCGCEFNASCICFQCEEILVSFN